MPEVFTEPGRCEPLLRAVLEHVGAFGVALEIGGEFGGYLAGYPRAEEIWGRACWSPVEGSALAEWVPAEAIRDLYAMWSDHFVRRGFFRQYVHAVAGDDGHPSDR